MVSSSVVASLVGFFAVCNAAPLLSTRAGSISSQCTNVRLSQGWLVGDCLTGEGNTTITSGTLLQNKIANIDGVLTWQESGSYSTSCQYCQVLNGGDLNCQCRPNFGQNKDAWLKLDEHIGVYSGHLLSDLTGAPVAPSSPSKYEFPSDVTYAFGGNSTCVAGSQVPDWCRSVAGSCSDGDKASLSETPFRQTAPISKCWAPSFYLADKFQFSRLKLAGSAAWELTGYADAACTKKIVSISADQAGKCETLPEVVKGVMSRPLFNGDPN